MSRELEVAVRAWAVPRDLPLPPGGSGLRMKPSAWTLVFDTETGLGLGQQLRVGAYQNRKGGKVKELGLIINPAALTDQELAVIRSYAREHRFRVVTRAEFVSDVFLRVGFRYRGLVIGLNLPFDISRLAVHHDTVNARGRNRAMRGGFTFQLTTDEHDPWVQVKKVSSAAAFIRFAIPAGNHPEARNRGKGGRAPHNRGAFCDVGTLAKTLLGGRWPLGRLADTLQTEHRKQDGERHGDPITPDYLDYAVNDVQVTWECYQALLERFHATGLDEVVPEYRVYSEASLGKAVLRRLKVPRWRRVQPDVPGWVTATIMETYYGGRTETRVRRMPTPGVLVDFRSQYSTSYVLQGMWRYQIGQGITWQDEDPSRVQRLLDQATTDQVLDRKLWPQLDALVLVAPDGDRLPTRARYRHPQGPHTVALPYRDGGVEQWWTLADCIASKLMTGKPPRAIKVLRFHPGPSHPDLDGVPDAIKQLVEDRVQPQQEAEAAVTRGDLAAAARWDAIARGKKYPASAASYGIPVEINLVDHRTKHPATVHLPTGAESYQSRVFRTEEPGEFFHPLIATLVSAGGRLLLATAISLVYQLGGEYAMCDTDGLFIAARPLGGLITCPGGPHWTEDGEQAVLALSWHQINDHVIAPFKRLNPYNPDVIAGSILRLEPENHDPDTGDRRVIECLAIAAKRYCLYTRTTTGDPVVVKRSEHGLGHLLPPADGDWQTQWWELIIRDELGLPNTRPDWFDRLAVGSVTVTTPSELRTWKTFNTTQPEWGQVGPLNFLMTAHTTRTYRAERKRPRVLIARLERDPSLWLDAMWIDKHDPDEGILIPYIGPPGDHIPRAMPALSLQGYWDEHRSRPEHKTLAPGGGPCRPWTRGLLQPLRITATSLERIGKETTPTADANTDPADPITPELVYHPTTCQGPNCDSPLTGKQRRYCSDRCRKRLERHLRVGVVR